jgi:hypothetical protein
MAAEPTESFVTEARALDYAPPDPLWTRLRRLIPRFRLLTCLLLPVTIALVMWFWQTCGVWTLQEITYRPGEEPVELPSLVLQPSPDDRHVAVGIGRRLRVVEIPTGRCVLDDSAAHGDYLQFFFSRDGRRLLSRDCTDFVRLFNMDTGRPLAEIQGVHEGSGRRESCLSEDGTRLVVWTYHGVALRDAQTGTTLRQLEPQNHPTAQQTQDVQITNDQRLAVVVAFDQVNFYRLADGTLDHGCRIPASFEKAVFHDGSALAVASLADNRLHIVDASSGTDRFPPLPVGTLVIRVEITRDGNRIVVVDDGAIRLIDARTGRLIKTQPASWLGQAGFDLQQSPDGRWLVLPVDQAVTPPVAGRPTARKVQLIFDARTLDLAATVPGFPPGTCQPFSPTGRTFVALSHEYISFGPDRYRREFTVWDATTWKPESKSSDPRLYGAQLLWHRADGTILTAHHADLNLWRQHRPAAWYGVAVLPQFWLALLVVALLVRSLWRDLRRWYGRMPEKILKILVPAP